jgi:small conductance mechanosensitive channel
MSDLAGFSDNLPQVLRTSDGIMRTLATVGGELLVWVLLIVAIAGILSLFVRRIGRLAGPEGGFAAGLLTVRRSLRSLFIALGILGCIGILGWNGWLLWQDEDPWHATVELINSVPLSLWETLALGAARSLVAVLGACVVVRYIRRFCRFLCAKAQQAGQIKANDESIATFFDGIERALVNVSLLLVAIYATYQLLLPAAVAEVLFRGATIYLVIAIGLSVVRIAAVVVESLDALTRTIAEAKSWHLYYTSLRPLVPTLRRCLEYAIWVGVATLVLVQLEPISQFAIYGPRLIQAIGIFFLARVAIEIGYLVIEQVMIGDLDIDETELRRRRTIVPLIKTLYRYIAYFVALVLMLGAIGFDPMPFLAGAGILGVVIGLGAQPLINDVVSGFFIIFENTFLVGDTVKMGDSFGVVESIDFRTTRLRDFDGNVHVLRNGDLRHVVNYSKEYTHAVLEVGVAYDSDIDDVEQAITEAADTLRSNPNVLGPMEFMGIVAFGDSAIDVRAVMRVRPGCHFTVATQWRAACKRAFDAVGIEIPFPQRVLTVVNQVDAD